MSHSSCVGRARTSRAAWTPRDKGKCFAVFVTSHSPVLSLSIPSSPSVAACRAKLGRLVRDTLRSHDLAFPRFTYLHLLERQRHSSTCSLSGAQANWWGQISQRFLVLNLPELVKKTVSLRFVTSVEVSVLMSWEKASLATTSGLLLEVASRDSRQNVSKLQLVNERKFDLCF